MSKQLEVEISVEQGHTLTQAQPMLDFGDHMELDGETSHMPTIMVLYYASIVFYSLLVSWMCGTGLWTTIWYYVAGMIAFYLWHLMAHSELTGDMHEIHLRHHVYTHPPSAFYGISTFLDLGKEDCPTFLDLLLQSKTTTTPLAHEGPLYILLAIILVGGRLICGSSLATLGMVFVLYLAMGVIGNAMHMSFHVKHFGLERYAWYRELRALHFLHHLGDMESNLAMVNSGMDNAMGSLAVHVSPAKKKQSGSDLTDLMHSVDLPQGITLADLQAAKGSAGLVAASLGFDLPLDIAHDHSKMHRPAIDRGIATVLLRALVVAACVNLWSSAIASSQFLLPESHTAKSPLVYVASSADVGQVWMAKHVSPLIFSQQSVVEAACLMSDFITHVSMGGLTLTAVAGNSFRPFLSMMIAGFVRYAIHQMGPVPAVAVGMSQWPLGQNSSTWIEPLPSSVADTSTFFSIRVCVACIMLGELLNDTLPARRNAAETYGHECGKSGTVRAITAFFGSVNVVFQVVLALCMRSSFTFDLIIAFVVGRYSNVVAGMYCSMFLDAFMP